VKKFAVAASVAVCVSMPSGAAFAQVGTVGADYSRMDLDSNGFGVDEADTYGINGAVALQTGGNMVVLLDAAYSNNDDADTSVLSGSAHLLTRNDELAYGGFVGLARREFAFGSDANVWGLGGEFAKFFDTSTLVLSAGWATAGNPSLEDTEILGATAEYRMFANDNLRFDIGGGWADIQSSFSGDDGTYIGAGVEWRAPNSPFSIGANYKHLDVGTGGNADAFGISLRFDFGSNSLKERDRKGNTFSNFGGLTNFLQ
jgi:hypothetical protein